MKQTERLAPLKYYSTQFNTTRRKLNLIYYRRMCIQRLSSGDLAAARVADGDVLLI